jgi:hypothetical protein
MIFLKTKIQVAAELLDNDITLTEKEFKSLYYEVGNNTSPDGEYLTSQLDLCKDTLTVPLHIAQHIYEILGS